MVPRLGLWTPGYKVWEGWCLNKSFAAQPIFELGDCPGREGEKSDAAPRPVPCQ